MRDARPIGEQASGFKRTGASLEHHFAPSARHILDGVKRKLFAADDVVGRAVFKSAADNHQLPVPGRIKIEVKSPGLRHVSGEELRRRLVCVACQKPGFHRIKSIMSMHWPMIAIPKPSCRRYSDLIVVANEPVAGAFKVNVRVAK